MTPRDIEKLKAIGYHFDGRYVTWPGCAPVRSPGKLDVWKACKTHAQSSEGLKATMADKVQFLSRQEVLVIQGTDGLWTTHRFGRAAEQTFGPSPEAAVDTLFWKVS